MVSLTTFTVFTLWGGVLRASSVFSALALFNAMRAPLSALPELFSSLAHAQVAITRFEQIIMPVESSRESPSVPPRKKSIEAEGPPPVRRPSRPMPKLSPALAKPMEQLHLPMVQTRACRRPNKTFRRRRTAGELDVYSDSSNSSSGADPGDESTGKAVL
eukprot:symbB.v1.2.003035.t1/scaffold168.1/size289517/13